VFQIKMAATLNLVLCLLVIYLAVNWVTLLLSPVSSYMDWIAKNTGIMIA